MTVLADLITLEEAVTDPTTGLLAGPGGRRILEKRLAACHPSQTLITVIDLDGLKEANDTAGHDAGDRLLAKAGEILRRGIRTDRDRLDLYRWGGDEFVIVHPNAPPDAAPVIEARLRRAFDGHRGVRASVGTAGTFADADERMLTHKRARKGNRWEAVR
jgi:diguanylate cyclase (GGDEF)-like protein